MTTHLAIDLGAGSGRAVLGRVAAGALDFEEVHRFHYQPRHVDGFLRWDASRLFEGLRTSLQAASRRSAARGERISSVGVDSWGVDYGLLDAEGRLVEDPICYRDERTAGVPEAVFARMPRQRVFARTGIQTMALNTLFQLFAHVRQGVPTAARRLLLIPDVCHHMLCGSVVSERTNASTTQMLDAATGGWDETIFAELGLPRALMPDIVVSGACLGYLRNDLAAASGLAAVPVLAPATHDTASAIAATSLDPDTAFISSGTWSLVGVERTSPLLTEAAAEANFTNEAGAFGTICFLKNVTGLWLLESCRREWQAAGGEMPLPDLLSAVGAVRGFAGFVFPDAPRFFNPASMTSEIAAALTDAGRPAPEGPVLIAKVILDSLAMRYASVIDTIELLTGRRVKKVHVVGGGSLNAYLNQATANATGRPVVAGPAEATAAGNVLIQAIAAGTLPSLAEARALLLGASRTTRSEPADAAAWRAARDEYREREVSE